MNISILSARTVCAFVSLALVVFFTTNARAADAPAVAGVWEYKDPAVAANSITFTLNPDGTGKVDDDAVTYTVTGNTIKIITGGETAAYTFKIDGDTMTVSGGDLDKPTPFARKNAAPKKGLGAKIKGLGAATATDVPKTDTPKTGEIADAAKAAIGRWEFKTDKASLLMTLDPDGTGTFNGKPMKWTLKDGLLTTAVGEASMAYQTTITGDTLKLTMPGGSNTIAFERAKTGAAQGSPFDVIGKVAGAAPATAAGLPGKWEATDGTLLEFGETSLLFNGLNVPYKAAGGKISITGAAGPIEWPYTVEGDKLTLTLEGTPQMLKRTGPAPAAAPEAKAAAGAGSPIGTWQAIDGDRLEIRANALVYGGNVIPGVLGEKSIRLTPNGQSIECPFEVTGDAMNITINGQPLALKRVAGGGGAAVPAKKGADAGDTAKPAADPKAIVGTWESAEGSVVVRADGTVRSNGSEGRYQIDDQFITLSDDKQWVKIPYKLDGDKLILGSGPSKTLTRAAGGPAGIYTVTESSLDPQFFMSITQYLTLYPDGSVGFEKSEGGASRTRIDENFVRFRSWKEKQGQAGKSYGRWTADANDRVTIQWQGAFKNATWQGRTDPKTGKLVLPHAGILNEGDTLAYEKQ